jgi:KipI family sensor histidine kinase inhibitor
LAEAIAGARALAARIRSAGDPSVQDVIPGARTALVLLKPGSEPSESLLAAIQEPLWPEPGDRGTLHTIEVSYGGEDGPDLPALATRAGVGERDAVAMHSAPLYTVAFIGFAPGFPYLLGLDARLAGARLSTPRPRIPAGSVGIGGEFTGIYPRATPGGWQLLGRTDAVLFDAGAADPALMTAGDRVRFVAR